MPWWDELTSDWTYTGDGYKGGVGSDKSHRYMKNKKSALYIGTDETSQRVIGFKPFIESFKIDIKMKTSDHDNVFTGRKLKEPINIGTTYSLSLVIPAASINEARMNKRKLRVLEKFIENYDSNTETVLTPKRHYIYLSNLIHNGNRSVKEFFTHGKNEIQTYQNFQLYACGGYITDVNYTAVTEDGFFEYDGGLYPKTFKTSITFIAFNEQREDGEGTSHYLSDGYLTADGTTTLSVANWPFGVKINHTDKKDTISISDFGYNFLANQGYGYDHHYADTKKSYIWIFPDRENAAGSNFYAVDNAIALAFKPYIDSFSFSRKTTKNEIFESHLKSDFYAYPAEDATYDLSFNILAENVNESIANHAKIQELIKFISPVQGGSTTFDAVQDTVSFEFVEKKQTNFVRVLFSNLIFNKYFFYDGDTDDPNRYPAGDIKDRLKPGYSSISLNEHAKYASAAAPFNLTNISYEPIVDMGFFEFSGMLWPKGIIMKLQLTENYKSDQKPEVYRLTDGNAL